MELTMAEKRDFLERMEFMIKDNILIREDRDMILKVCLAACLRELAELHKEK